MKCIFVAIGFLLFGVSHVFSQAPDSIANMSDSAIVVQIGQHRKGELRKFTFSVDSIQFIDTAQNLSEIEKEYCRRRFRLFNLVVED